MEPRLSAVDVDQLERPSSCQGWSIYDLVNHVNGGAHRYLLLLRGASAEQLTGTRAQDHVRPNPLKSYRYWQRPLVAAFAKPHALTGVVHHPVGDRSGLDLLRMRTLDLALHAWDLARSLDLDQALDTDNTVVRFAVVDAAQGSRCADKASFLFDFPETGLQR